MTFKRAFKLVQDFGLIYNKSFEETIEFMDELYQKNQLLPTFKAAYLIVIGEMQPESV